MKQDVDMDEWRERLAVWLASEAYFVVPTDLASRFECLREWQRRLYDAGWLKVGWPSAYGGAGGTILDRLALTDELVKASSPLPIGVVGIELIAPVLLSYATEDQKRVLLPRLLRGDDIWCQGFSEPDHGSDLASLETRAVIDGNEYVISGRKIWTTLGQFATHCAVLARTDPDVVAHKGISYLLVDMAAGGISVRPIEAITGDAEFCEVTFDDVRTPRDSILGSPGQGWEVAMATLTYERGPYLIRRQAEIEVEFSSLMDVLRNVSPHGDRALAAQIGKSRVLLSALGAMGRSIAEHLLAERPLASISSVGKALLGETEQAVFELALEAADRFELTPETDASWRRGYFYSRAATVYGGSIEIQRNILAERALGLPREAR